MSVYIQVLKDMANLLNAVSGELTNEHIKNQANLLEKKVHSALNEMTDSLTDTTKERNSIGQDGERVEKKSKLNAASPLTPSSARSSPFAEAEGKPVAGISISYVNSIEQKKGHRRRQSMPLLPETTFPQENEDQE